MAGKLATKTEAVADTRIRTRVVMTSETRSLRQGRGAGLSNTRLSNEDTLSHHGSLHHLSALPQTIACHALTYLRFSQVTIALLQ